MLFQTLGSNFMFRDACRQLFSFGGKKDSEQLKQFLETRYEGKVELYYKGRIALAEAIKLATGGSGKVAVNAFTCYSVVQSVRTAGCDPVYIDINKKKFHFDSTQLEHTYKNDTDIKVVVVQNTFGIPCDIDPIETFARKNNIIIIEDLAHCIGARYADGREVGTVGDVSICSFGRDKIVDVVNGGALIVRDKVLQKSMQTTYIKPKFRNQFRDRLYPILTWKIRVSYPLYLGKALQAFSYKTGLMVRSADGTISTKYNLPGWYCKLVLRELCLLDSNISNRNAIADTYIKRFEQDSALSSLESSKYKTSYIRFPILVTKRDVLLKKYKLARMFLADTWYDTPISPKRFMDSSGYVLGSCPVAEKVCSMVINLPTHRNVGKVHIEKLISITREHSNV